MGRSPVRLNTECSGVASGEGWLFKWRQIPVHCQHACPLTDNAQGSQAQLGPRLVHLLIEPLKSVAGVQSSEPSEQWSLEESYVAHAPSR